MRYILTLSLYLWSLTAQGQPEAQYVQETCRGQIEHRLPDNTRVDCLTDEYAIEYDFSRKWAEAIGQALHYSLMTDRKAGVVLIGSQQDKGFQRAKEVIKVFNLPITLNSLKRVPTGV